MDKKKLFIPGGRTVGEFVLVVLGVLVALMVDTWIEQRSEDKLAQDYMLSLTDDLLEDQRKLESRVSFFSLVSAFGLETLDRLQSDEAVDQDALLAAYFASEFWDYAPVNTTYEDLQSTGNIRLLGNLELRLALGAYHAQINAEAGGLPRMYRETVRGIIPMKIQTAIREHCPTIDESGEKMTGFPPCTLPGVTATEVTDVFNSIRACPRIVETLTYHVSAVDVAVYLFNAQISSLSDILARLERR